MHVATGYFKMAHLSKLVECVRVDAPSNKRNTKKKHKDPRRAARMNRGWFPACEIHEVPVMSN